MVIKGVLGVMVAHWESHGLKSERTLAGLDDFFLITFLLMHDDQKQKHKGVSGSLKPTGTVFFFLYRRANMGMASIGLQGACTCRAIVDDTTTVLTCFKQFVFVPNVSSEYKMRSRRKSKQFSALRSQEMGDPMKGGSA
jgi:hypothetical protein